MSSCVVEDTYHFLFSCERFHDLRQESFNTIIPICQPTFNILFFGGKQLTDLEIRPIFTAVQGVLIKSKRFEIA